MIINERNFVIIQLYTIIQLNSFEIVSLSTFLEKSHFFRATSTWTQQTIFESGFEEVARKSVISFRRGLGPEIGGRGEGRREKGEGKGMKNMKYRK